MNAAQRLQRLRRVIRLFILQVGNRQNALEIVALRTQMSALIENGKDDPNRVGDWLEQAAWPEVYGRPMGYDPSNPAAF